MKVNNSSTMLKSKLTILIITVFCSTLFSQKQLNLNELLGASLKNNFDIELASINLQSASRNLLKAVSFPSD